MLTLHMYCILQGVLDFLLKISIQSDPKVNKTYSRYFLNAATFYQLNFEEKLMGFL